VDSLHKVEFSLNATITSVIDAKERLLEQTREVSDDELRLSVEFYYTVDADLLRARAFVVRC
jgi:hypothetical protein